MKFLENGTFSVFLPDFLIYNGTSLNCLHRLWLAIFQKMQLKRDPLLSKSLNIYQHYLCNLPYRRVCNHRRSVTTPAWEGRLGSGSASGPQSRRLLWLRSECGWRPYMQTLWLGQWFVLTEPVMMRCNNLKFLFHFYLNCKNFCLKLFSKNQIFCQNVILLRSAFELCFHSKQVIFFFIKEQ